MARRKTKVSPCTWRLDAPALNALTILEAEEPDKPRGKLIGEILIAQANKTEIPPTIEFAEFDAVEMFALRAAVAGLTRILSGATKALRAASPGNEKDALLLQGALKQFEEIAINCKKTLNAARDMANKSASVRAETIISFEEVYQIAASLHRRFVETFGKDPKAPKQAKALEKLANFLRVFRQDVGPEIQTPKAFPTVKVGNQIMQGEIGGFGDA